MTSLSLTSHPLCLHLHPCCSPFASLLSWLVKLYVLLSVCFSDCLFVPLSFHLPVWLLSPCWPVCLSVFLSVHHLSSVFLSIGPSVLPSGFCLPVGLSFCLSFCLPVCLFVCLFF